MKYQLNRRIKLKPYLIAFILFNNINTTLACIDPALSDAEQIAPCLILAKQGQADSQFELGKRYEQGLGVPANSTAAEAWYLKAAESGHVSAQYALALMYDSAPVVAEQAVEPEFNSVTSLRSFNTDAAGANLGTTFDLCLDIGEGPIKAIQWYRQAAQQGHTDAQFKLGQVYEQGRGVPQDDMLAYMWFDIATRQGRKATGNIKMATAARLSPELQQEAENLAEEWLLENRKQ